MTPQGRRREAVLLVLAGSFSFVAGGCACKTACDCKPGFDCIEGDCVSGTVAVYCCDACPPGAPAGQVCETRDGERRTCGEPASLSPKAPSVTRELPECDIRCCSAEMRERQREAAAATGDPTISGECCLCEEGPE